MLLYVHPRGHLNELAVPVGALSVMNAAPGPKLGRYAFEVSDDEIRAATALVSDLHWALALPGLEALVRHARLVNPRAPIVVGGITAGMYPELLLERLGVDYAIQGDAEVAFAELATRLFAGEDPGTIANVYRRGQPPPPRRRMTQAELDATDSVTASWFPTYERARGFDAEAFSHACTISVTRGCPMRCSTCYGSFASSFGPGTLSRSPESLVRSVARARDTGVPALRLLLGKMPQSALEDALDALARAGPFDFSGDVGLYLCSPPSDAALDSLLQGLAGRVVLSTTVPSEQQPRLSRSRAAAEWARWVDVARRARAHGRLGLDVWALDGDRIESARVELCGFERPDNIRVTSATTWNMTRPMDQRAPGDFERVREALAPAWSFYALRLSSPSADRFLSRFAWLDDLGPEVDEPVDPFGTREHWLRDRLPVLPALGFAAVCMTQVVPTTRLLRAVPSGDVCWAMPSEASVVSLERLERHDAVVFRAELELTEDAAAVGIVPMVKENRIAPEDEVLCLRLFGPVPVGQRVVVELRFLLDGLELTLAHAGGVIASGRVNLGLYRSTEGD